MERKQGRSGGCHNVDTGNEKEYTGNDWGLTPKHQQRLETIAGAYSTNADPAHDGLHVRRVAALAAQIGAAEGASLAVVVPAALLHELFSYPKNHLNSAQSGGKCAEMAGDVLRAEGYPSAQTEAICECIRVHSYSREINPRGRDPQVLQDADRLDAIGAIGIARCFATGTTMQRPFYAPDDPFCRARTPDDTLWTLDHFYRKLLCLPQSLHTPTARALAQSRLAFLEQFLDQLAQEIGGA